jgi:hypothetical protein
MRTTLYLQEDYAHFRIELNATELRTHACSWKKLYARVRSEFSGIELRTRAYNFLLTTD